MWSFRTHTGAVAEDRLRGKEVHALVTYLRGHGERPGQRDVHQRDDHAAGVGDTALQPVDRDVGLQERYVVGHVKDNPYVGMKRVEGR